jgi:hypothetical protein
MSSWKFSWYNEAILNDSDFIIQWNKISDLKGSIFSYPEMIKIWIDVYAKNCQLFFCIARNAQNDIIILPFYMHPPRVSRLNKRALIYVGDSRFDYQEIILECNDDTTFSYQEFWDSFEFEIKSNCKWIDYVVFSKIRRDCAPSDASCSRDIGCPYIKLDNFSNLEEYEKSLSRKLRNDIKRQIRRLEKIGRIGFYVFDRHETEKALIEFNKLIVAYEEVWAEEQSKYFFKISSTVEFYYKLINNLLPKDLVHFSILTLNNSPIAWHFGFYFNKSFHYYKPAYDIKLKDYSPGKILLYRLIKNAFERNDKYFDFGFGLEKYKLEWTKDISELKEFIMFSNSLRSSIYKIYKRIKT